MNLSADEKLMIFQLPRCSGKLIRANRVRRYYAVLNSLRMRDTHGGIILNGGICSRQLLTSWLEVLFFYFAIIKVHAGKTYDTICNLRQVELEEIQPRLTRTTGAHTAVFLVTVTPRCISRSNWLMKDAPT